MVVAVTLVCAADLLRVADRSVKAQRAGVRPTCCVNCADDSD